MAIFYFIDWIVAAETTEGGKLFKGGNYLRKYDTHSLHQSATSIQIQDVEVLGIRPMHKFIFHVAKWELFSQYSFA